MVAAEAEAAASEDKRLVMEEYYKGHPNIARVSTAPLKVVMKNYTSRLGFDEALQASGG